MSIPFAYNLRNLVVRKTTTIMTALGIALTVAVLLAILALVNGLRNHAFGPRAIRCTCWCCARGRIPNW
jgi:ABC-type lipoprotein release transport system permease subunit